MCCGWGGWMGGWGGFGILGWFVGLIFSLILIVLVIVGIVWLIRQLSRSGRGNPPISTSRGGPFPPGRTCPTCGRPMAADWTVCPYDGTPLT